MELTGEKIIKNLANLKSSRGDFDTMYQELHNRFYVESSNIIEERSKGSRLHALLDSTALDCADVAASGLANYLTPNTAKWLYLEHQDRVLRDDKEIKQWMQDASDEVLSVLAGSNFYDQMPLFYKASVVYGTAVMFCEQDEEDGVRFYTIPIKNTYIVEDARERPCEFYLIFEYTAEEAWSRFKEAVSDEIKEALKSGKNEDKKYKFICYIGKRLERDDKKMDKNNMPIRMAWVDEKTKAIVKEDGFHSMPCVAHRFYKRPQIVYGYSPAMKAMPYTRMMNAMSDTMLRSAMKQTDPAIMLPHDAFLGTPNFNPRAINYYQRGKLNPKDEILPVGNFGHPNIGVETLEYYKKQIRDIMFYTTFQAFSELTKQMTVPEVMERISEKMTVLGPAVGRFMNDVLQPLIEKVVMILYNAGKLPPMPEGMMKNPSFEVKFVGRLVQSQRQSEINNIVNAIGIIGQVAQVKPEVLDKINADEVVTTIANITGLPASMIYSDDEVRKLREQRAEAQAQEAQLMQAQTLAQTYKTASEGDRNAAQIEG